MTKENTSKIHLELLDQKRQTLLEAAILKAYTIGRRGAFRDYFDLYALLKDKYTTLNEIILKAQDIYGVIFNPKIFLEQLVYFDDLTDFEIIPIKENQTIPGFKQVKEFLEESVKKLILI